MSRWRVVTTRKFDNAIKQLDRRTARRILNYLDDLSGLDNPKGRGKPLTGSLAGYWRYRVGDYRILARINEHETTIIALDTGHRSGRIYRQPS